MLHRPWLLVLAAVTLATACSDDGNGQEPTAATAGVERHVVGHAVVERPGDGLVGAAARAG
jgi:hypothetical protein